MTMMNLVELVKISVFSEILFLLEGKDTPSLESLN